MRACSACTCTALMTSRVSVCRDDQFACLLDCIPADWRCDGEIDCPSVLDETGCDAGTTIVKRFCCYMYIYVHGQMHFDANMILKLIDRY